MFLADRLTFDAPRRTRDGYLAVRAKAARSGVQDYLGIEVDPEGKRFKANDKVGVYRPEAEVFDEAAVASFLMKPVTNDHPSEAVTADNWKDKAKGVVGKALRDGDHLAFDIVIFDAATIADVEAGKRELSNGYGCELTFGDGTAPDGTPFQATQTAIRGNHVAIVDRARAGHECRIGDAQCASIPAIALLDRLLDDGRTYTGAGNGGNSDSARREASQSGDGTVTTKTITFDGLPVEVTDAAEAVIRKLEGQLKDAATARTGAETKVGELTATVSTKDGEIAALTTKLKDAEVTPERLQAMAADRASLIAAATAVVPGIVTDKLTAAEIRKAVVTAKLGDSAKDMDEAALGGAFSVLAKDVKPADPVRDVVNGGVRTTTNDSGASVRDLARMSQY